MKKLMYLFLFALLSPLALADIGSGSCPMGMMGYGYGMMSGLGGIWLAQVLYLAILVLILVVLYLWAKKLYLDTQKKKR